MRGVDAIAHTASPFHLKARHPDGTRWITVFIFPPDSFYFHLDLIKPAVQGTVAMLTSALKHGCAANIISLSLKPDTRTSSTSVKRVVMTSSCVAVKSLASTPMRYRETDWNTAAIREVEEKGDNSSGSVVYMASKTLAEQGELTAFLRMWGWVIEEVGF